MTRVPTEALRGPEALQNLQLQDNLIGKTYLFSCGGLVVSMYALYYDDPSSNPAEKKIIFFYIVVRNDENR